MTNNVAPFEIWYFKPSGKYYSEGELEGELLEGVNPRIANMYHAKDTIKSLMELDKPLLGLHSSLWKDGSIVINHPDGFPIMITQREVNDIIFTREHIHGDIDLASNDTQNVKQHDD